MKICSECKRKLEESDFYKDNHHKNGLRSNCKVCSKKSNQTQKRKEYYKLYYLKNKDKIKEQNNKYNKAHKKERKLYRKDYYNRHKKEETNKRKIYNDSHKEENSIRNKLWYENNKEIICRQHKQWRKNNPNYHKKYWEINKNKLSKNVVQYENNRRKNDPIFRLTRILRCRLKMALNGKNKSTSTKKLIGCSIEYLIMHLQFTAYFNGYDDFDILSYSGKDFHIDHIKACETFNLSEPTEQRKCFNWKNLQILSTDDHKMKHKNNSI